MPEKQARAPIRRSSADAIGHDQLRDADDGVERGRAPSDADARMPHERDEYPDPHDTGTRDIAGPREVVDQASRDVNRGLRDTERRGVPTDVPSPADGEEAQGDMQFDESARAPRRRRIEDQR